MARLYQLDELPSNRSWIYELNAEQANEQCIIFNLQPCPNLAANREMLSTFLKNLAQAENALNRRDISGNLSESSQQVTLSAPTTTSLPSPVPTTLSTTSAMTLTSVLPTPVVTPTVTPLNHPTVPGAPPLPVALAPDWSEVIQATAAAVGSQIAHAIREATNQPNTESGNSHILNQLLREIPSVSGADPEKLVSFWIQINRIVRLHLTSQANLITQVFHKTTEQLRHMWSQAIADRTTLEQLQLRSLEIFVPERVRHGLISTMVYRGQRKNERLPEFVTSIQDSAALLAPQVDSVQLLEIALTGLNSETRACLAGFAPARSIQELLDMAPRIEAVKGLASLAETGVNGAPRTDQMSVNAGYRQYPPQLHRAQQRPPINYSNSAGNFPNGNAINRAGPSRGYPDPAPRRDFPTNNTRPFHSRGPGQVNWRGGR